jgi:hypothetical protein
MTSVSSIRNRWELGILTQNGVGDIEQVPHCSNVDVDIRGGGGGGGGGGGRRVPNISEL